MARAMWQTGVWMALTALKPNPEQLKRHRDPEKLAGLKNALTGRWFKVFWNQLALFFRREL